MRPSLVTISQRGSHSSKIPTPVDIICSDASNFRVRKREKLEVKKRVKSVRSLIYKIDPRVSSKNFMVRRFERLQNRASNGLEVSLVTHQKM